MSVVKQKLNVVLVEFNPVWLDKNKNLNYLNFILKNTISDIIILPEMFNTGYCTNPKLVSETDKGETFLWMQQKSKELNTTIIGSFAFSENNKFYNRCFVFQDGNLLDYYDKRHLFSYSKENLYYESGTQQKIVDIFGWKVFLSICYDLRFPVWLRNTNKYDLMINVASWPKSRIKNWNILLNSRAIENQVFVCGVNRIGEDGNNLIYSGDSKIVDPFGDDLEPEIRNNNLIFYELDYSKIETVRYKYPFLDDSDKFEILN